MVNLNGHRGRVVWFLVWATSAVLAATEIGSQLASAQSFSTLYSFPGGAHGAYPYAGLISDGKGTLYGTTNGGGSSHHGTVFSLSGTGKERVLYSFAKPRGGEYPYAVLLDSSGDLYGTTPFGGISGKGVVFRVDKQGRETVLYRFAGKNDGKNPYSGMVRDSSDDWYGTTLFGGTVGGGTVFKIDKRGQETILHSFVGYNGDGAEPYAGLIQDAQGNMYGTTASGGGGTCVVECGTVFKVDTSGTVTTLYSFKGGMLSDGQYPYAGVVLDSSGVLYGTTNEGGSAGYGTVFKVDAQGNETVLSSFAGGTDGAYPYAGVVLDGAGKIYGTTVYGGASGYGTVFRVDTSGKETVLHSFAYSDGAYPYGTLIRDASGALYGTTERGGRFGYGTVFRLK